MGTFPHGGAVIVRIGGLYVPAGVSGLAPIEDDALAKTAAALAFMRLAAHYPGYELDKTVLLEGVWA